MSFGMTWEQYWYGDVRMTRSFYEAHRLRKKEENERLWLQGMYFFDGISAALANFGNSLAGARGRRRAEYSKKPYEIFKEEPRPEAPKEKEDREERERLRAEVYMRQMFEAGKNWGRK